MSKEKAIALLLICSIISFSLRTFNTQKVKNNFTIEGITIDRKPYLELINSMFEQSVDSNKACDCLLTNFYEIIKNDSSKKAKFKTLGMFQLDTPYLAAYNNSFAKCILKNTIDTSYKLKIRGIFKEVFTRDLKSELKNYQEFKDINEDSAVSCLINTFDQKITIKEYYEENEKVTEKFKDGFRKCLFLNLKE